MRTIAGRLRRAAHTAVPALGALLDDLDRAAPVLIYQMGKVGSTTVYETLRALEPHRPIYQVHFLSREGLQSTRAFYRSVRTTPFQEHVLVAQALALRIRLQPGRRWKIITLVRDPVGRDISGFFQHVETSHAPLCYEDGEVAIAHAEGFVRDLAALFERYDERTDFACNWFDKELKRVFGIDVFAHPFPAHRGWLTISGERADVLVIRLEDLATALGPGLDALLGGFAGRPVKPVTANAAEDRRVLRVYRRVRETLRLPPDVCRRVYGSRYCRHFYSDAEIAKMAFRWYGATGPRRGP